LILNSDGTSSDPLEYTCSGKHKIVAIKKTLIFFFAFLVLSGKLRKQSLKFRAAIYFIFGITIFLCQDKNPVDHMIHWRRFPDL
jgi:hypothetical protein